MENGAKTAAQVTPMLQHNIEIIEVVMKYGKVKNAAKLFEVHVACQKLLDVYTQHLVNVELLAFKIIHAALRQSEYVCGL